MGNKISKASDAAFARVTFNLLKSDIRASYKDYLALELLREESSMAFHTLSSQLDRHTLHQLPQRIEAIIKSQPNIEEESPERFLQGYRNALLERYAHTSSISTAHLLRDIIADAATATSQVLAEHGISVLIFDNIMQQLSDVEEGEQSDIQIRIFGINRDAPIKSTSHEQLERFGTDLTLLAKCGKIDPVVGREEEIARTIQILSRRKKSNPILIGEAGVGKSAIVEGLALRIAHGEVPQSLRNKCIFSLDVSSLVAGTKFRGEFEERMQQLLEELLRADDTILFIDEIHTIVGAGATQGTLDTANILKPALARGEIQTIGATTLDEYRRTIENDAALERRFQRVMVEPTTASQTLSILKSIAPRYEHHHAVCYSDEALQACITLTERYITDRYLPDKAIDVMDEAGASAHHNGLSHGCITISADDIAKVVTAMTGIPAERISHSEKERLRHLEEHLRRRVIGQEEAVGRVVGSLQRSRAGLKEENRPMGVFLFTGPSGVGKTLLAKELSKHIFGSEQRIIRIDMSEYAERHTISRLIGSPPGYVGYGDGGQLTESVRRRPYSVILFDEIEKAHPDIFNTMLQLFDEGHLTDGQGRKVDFRNTVIILTSNLGSRANSESIPRIGFNTPSKKIAVKKSQNDGYRRAIEHTFAPEFINRIDEIVCFRELSIDDVERITALELEATLARTRRLGLNIEITPEARRNIARAGYEPQYGVRSLKRTITSQIEEPLSSMIIDGTLSAGGNVIVEECDDRICLRVA